MGAKSTSVEAAGSLFLGAMTELFESIVLARLFVVRPFEDLPQTDQSFAAKMAGADRRLTPSTPCLNLLATRGREPAWNDRKQSRGHRAIPLIDRAFVSGAPMLAKLLADLEIDLRALDAGQPIDVRRMLGSQNGTFYVQDAQTASHEGRMIIADREFVATHAVRTVFGMGGAYANGLLVIAIVFSTELLDQLTVARYPSLISNFKIATGPLVERDQLYEG